ncbi:MAG: hypothetical protein KR126chlam6_01315 [Candidatus Anoxychlamydiales bacterium]|nr:hypothetical protein [Candidatus Anoxychlamydiales bacterium]
MSSTTPTTATPRPAGFSSDFPLPSFGKIEFVPSNHPALRASTTLKLGDLPLEILTLIAGKFFPNDYKSFGAFKCTARKMNAAANLLFENQKPRNERKLVEQADRASKRKREENLQAYRDAQRPTRRIAFADRIQ